MNNNTPTVIVELPGKFSDDVMDYVVDLSAYVDDAAAIDNVSVSIDAAGNGESPPEMEASDAEAIAVESGGLNKAVHFWLSGGTSGVRYRGVIEFGDDQAQPSPALTRMRRKLFYIVVS